MANRSHFNSGHRMMNYINKTTDIKHKSERTFQLPDETSHLVAQTDCIDFLKTLPNESIQLVLIDPPYNIAMADWDVFGNYIDWASGWIEESQRVLTKSGSFVIFGGIQFENAKSGDLLELMHHLRHHTDLKLVNLIIWHYKNGMSAHRFFANRHEEIAWYVKSGMYTFNLDDIRVPYDEVTKQMYMTDKRLKPESIEKGKNPTNVWEMSRLNGNSKERVGHPTQKPTEVVRRLVRALTNPGDTVLDFFAGSGTTTRICIEESRHSMSVDTDASLSSYLQSHIKQLPPLLTPAYRLIASAEEFRSHPVFSSAHKETT